MKTHPTLLLILGLIACAWGCAESRRIPELLSDVIQKNDISIYQIGTPGGKPPDTPNIQTGDWVIKTPTMTVVVSGHSPSHRRRFPPGSIIHLEVGGEPIPRLSEYRQIARLGNRNLTWKRIQIAHQIIDGQLGIRVIRTGRNCNFEMETRITPSKDMTAVDVVSKLVHRQKTTVSLVSLGSEIWWDGGYPFAMEAGWVRRRKKRLETSFVAAVGEKKSGAVVALGKPFAVDFSPSGMDLHFIRTGLKYKNVPANREIVASERFIVGTGDLTGVANEIWKTRNQKTGTVNGRISPNQDWAEIAASPLDGKPWLAVNADKDGTFSMPLPLGTYDILLRCPGGETHKTVTLTEKAPLADLLFKPAAPGVLTYKIVDTQNTSIPGRMIIRGTNGTKDPILGPKYNADGAGNVRYSASGTGQLRLPQGSYRITTTHGPEYTIRHHRVAISPSQGVRITPQLQRVVDTGDWISSDLHLHTATSFDSDVTHRDRVISLLAENVRFAAVTDHNMVETLEPAIQSLAVSDYLISATGVEVTTWNPIWGHFNAWPLPTGAEPPPYSQETPESIFQWIRRQYPQSLIQVNHPRMDEHNIGYFTITKFENGTADFNGRNASKDFDTVEIWNGYDLGHLNKVEQVLEDWYGLLNSGMRVAGTGGSDSHYLLYSWSGYPRTYIRVPLKKDNELDITQIRDAVKAGHVTVSNGPFITASIEGKGPGETVEIDGTATVEIKIQRAPWIRVNRIRIIVNGETIENRKLQPAEREKTNTRLAIPLRFNTESSWLVVIAEGDTELQEVLPWSKTRPFAFTNPIFVEKI